MWNWLSLALKKAEICVFTEWDEQMDSRIDSGTHPDQEYIHIPYKYTLKICYASFSIFSLVEGYTFCKGSKN